MRPSGSLVRSAARRLAGGPAHTLELARDVLGLSGHSGAAAAAVFQLLGTDTRFVVDAEGVWSLAPDAAPPGRPLDEVPFVVVDVETTGGGRGRGHRIIDLAMVEVRGGVVGDAFHTLVNPGRGIPVGVTALTGIRNEDVAEAPYFDHVADAVAERLEGRVFVAHNAAFDWGFVREELLRATGDAPSPPRLCTVRMVRRLVPGLRRRNLDVVARHFSIPIHQRHRAYGDALATARILVRLLDEARGLGLCDLDGLQSYLSARRRRRDPAQTALELPRRRRGLHGVDR